MSTSFKFGAKNGPPAFGNSAFDCCSEVEQSVALSFTTKFVVKPRILELSKAPLEFWILPGRYLNLVL